MTEAQKTLQISKMALDMLEDETDKQRFQVEYYSAISSLRSVGHVLDKVDKKRFPEKQSAIDAWWDGIHSNRACNQIFFDFIEKERNNLLKEGSMNYDIIGDNFILAVNDMLYPVTMLTEDCVFVPVESDTYAGEDVRDVIKCAIEWWEQQLSLLGLLEE